MECEDESHTLCEAFGQCVDTDSDVEHCGDCGTNCGANEVCENGDCVCAPGFEDCDGDCVDLDTNHDHCGECSQDCTAVEVCNDGICDDDCPESQTACGSECVDTDSDSDHCGDCNEPCTGSEDNCLGGECVQCIDGEDCDTDEFCDGNNTCQCEELSCDDVECGEISNACDFENCGECGGEDVCVENECAECANDADCGNDEFCDGNNTCECEALTCGGDDSGMISNACSDEYCGPCTETFDALEGDLNRFIEADQCGAVDCGEAAVNCSVEDPTNPANDDSLHVERTFEVGTGEGGEVTLDREARAFASFDTSAIPDDAEIVSVIIHAQGWFTEGDTSAVLYGGGQCLGASVTVDDWVSCDVEVVSGPVFDEEMSFELDEGVLDDAIDPTGYSQFRLRSDATCNNEDRFRIRAANHDDHPRLEVTWEE